METLKLTTLVVFIPLGWLMTEAAAYPQTLEDIHIVPNGDPKLGCIQTQSGSLGFDLMIRNQIDLPDEFKSRAARTDTTSSPRDSDVGFDACRLDIETFGKD